VIGILFSRLLANPILVVFSLDFLLFSLQNSYKGKNLALPLFIVTAVSTLLLLASSNSIPILNCFLCSFLSLGRDENLGNALPTHIITIYLVKISVLLDLFICNIKCSRFVHCFMEFTVETYEFESIAMKLVYLERIEYFLESSIADFSLFSVSRAAISCLATTAWMALVCTAVGGRAALTVTV
jgi:hypothetical protein